MKLRCECVSPDSSMFTEGKIYPVVRKEGWLGRLSVIIDDLGHERAMRVKHDTARFITGHTNKGTYREIPEYAYFELVTL